VIVSSNPHARRQGRRAGPAPVIYMIRSEIKSPGQTGWQFNLFSPRLTAGTKPLLRQGE
jgi:hypothetical protein